MKTSFISNFIYVIVCTQQAVFGFTPKNLEELTIYYDDNDEPVPMLTNKSEVLPSLKAPSLRFGPLPCSCQDLTCGCCANMNIQFFNFQRRACTNFTYDPYEFSIGMNMLWNEESIFQRNVSAKNPPPMCAQAPVPYLPTIDQCVRLFNIFTPGRNIHMCMNLETRIERVPVLVLQFDCMRMGLDGVALLKPEEEGGLNPPEQETTETPTSEVQESPQEAANIFDMVDPNKKKVNQTSEETSMEVPTTEAVILHEEEVVESFGNESVTIKPALKGKLIQYRKYWLS